MQNENAKTSVNSQLSKSRNPTITQFIKSVGEEYKVGKRGREYYGFGEEYNVEKKEWGKQYYLPNNIKAAGKNITRGRKEGDRIFR